MWILGLKALKELCSEIYQNSTKGTSTNLTETKTTAQNMKRRYKKKTQQIQKKAQIVKLEED